MGHPFLNKPNLSQYTLMSILIPMKQAHLNRLIQTIKSEKVPFSVVFEITKRCNLRCLHCYLPSDQDQSAEMEIAEIRSLLDDLEKAGCLKLTLTGGEPTLRGDFLEILSYCHQKGFATTLFTNATLLTPEVKRAIRKRPPFAVECSLYGASPKVHDAITQVEGSFHTSIENIKWMASDGIRVIVKSVIVSLNLQEIEALDDLCKGSGVIFHLTFRVFPSLDPARSPERLRIKMDQVNFLLQRRERPFFVRGHRSDQSQEEFICNAGREACCISAEGKVYPCVSLRWECGDLRNKSFHEIWTRSPVLKEIRSYKEEDFKDCFRCKWKADCHFCPGMGFFEHGNMLRPSKELCRLTRAIALKVS
jgi:radical SAM protein with 4Fe4S-binding SPASM domain